jgi:hypothetical protein
MKKITHKIVKKSGIVTGTIPVYINNNEYINMYPFIENECDWIEIIDKNINFDTEQIFNIRYNIDSDKIKGRYGRAVVVLDEKIDKKVVIEAFIIPDFIGKINKNNFLYTDEGDITVQNNTGKKADIKAFSSENFVKLGKMYNDDENIVIPFEIKVPIFTRTQLEIYGKPYIEAHITVNFVQNGRTQSKTFNITAGTEFAE